MKHITFMLVVLAAGAFAQQSSDPGGPVVNPGMSPRVTADGVEASGYRFTPAKDAGKWQAPWIWLDPAAGAADGIAASFRKTVSLPAAPKAVRARVSAGRTGRRLNGSARATATPAATDPGVSHASKGG